MTSPNEKLIKTYMDLNKQKRILKAELDSVNIDISKLEPQITKYFKDSKTQKITRDGYTIYIRRDLSIKSVAGDTQDIVNMIRRGRYPGLLMVNHQGLKAFVKEKMFCKSLDTYEINMRRLPPSLRKVIEVSEYNRPTMIKAN